MRPLGHNPWQYSANFELGNGRDQDINVNYNTFLSPPSARSNQFFKPGAGAFYQLPLAASNKSPRAHFSSLGNVYSSSIRNPSEANAVTEFSGHKPFTAHASFNPADARTQFSLKQTNFGTTGSFVPLILNNEPQRSYAKPLPPLNDNLPENFAYYHIGNEARGKFERDQFQPLVSTPRPVQQQLSLHQPARPQAPVYYLEKPSKGVVATTPKSQYVQFSTVGGFYNNNPTAFPIIEGSKKHKNRPSGDKYGTATHRPAFQDAIVSTATPAPGREMNKNAETYYRIHGLDSPKHFRPEEGRPNQQPRPTYLKTVPVHEIKPSKSPLYSYDITTDEVKAPPQPKKPTLYLTQSSRDKEHNYKVVSQTPNYVKHLTGEKRPHATAGPQVGVDFDFNRFIHEIRESQANKAKPPPPIGKQQPQQIHQLHKEVFPPKLIGSTTPVHATKAETTTLNSDDYYYYDGEEEVKPTVTAKKHLPVTERYTPTTTKSSTPIAPKPNKESFINALKQGEGSLFTLQRPSATSEPEQEYFEYEDDDEAPNDDEPEFHYKLPPQNVSKFMPMSETAAPRPASMLATSTYRPSLSSHGTQKSPPFNRHQSTKPAAPSTVPAIIKFPDGVFETIQPMHRYANQTATRPPTRTRGQTSDAKSTTKTYTKTTKVPPPASKQTTKHTTQHATTTLRTHSFRPSGKTRGQTNIPAKSKWNVTKAPKSQQPQRPNSLKKNLWDLDERLPNRYFPSARAELIFNRLRICGLCRVESSSTVPEGNRNYYNITSHEPQNPSQYNTYFSVYDEEAQEDADLYRDGKSHLSIVRRETLSYKRLLSFCQIIRRNTIAIRRPSTCKPLTGQAR